MEMFRWKLYLMLILGCVLTASGGTAQEGPLAVRIADGRAEAVLVEGSVIVVRRGMTAGEPLKSGDVVEAGDRVTTRVKARLDLELPDGSHLRFDEGTTFELVAAAYDAQRKQRNIRAKMVLGKIWARVSRLIGGRGRFAIQTNHAVAGVRGTTYRMNVREDAAATVKVYDGAVEVKRLGAAEKAAPQGPSPAPLTRPRPIQGPHPVSMEQWVYIVRSLQQIDIRPDGTASRPFRFDIQADLNDWVRWNQRLDRQITVP